MTNPSPLTADQQAELDLLHALEDREKFLIGIIHELQERERLLRDVLRERRETAVAMAQANLNQITVATHFAAQANLVLDIEHWFDGLTSSPVESPR